MSRFVSAFRWLHSVLVPHGLHAVLLLHSLHAVLLLHSLHAVLSLVAPFMGSGGFGSSISIPGLSILLDNHQSSPSFFT